MGTQAPHPTSRHDMEPQVDMSGSMTKQVFWSTLSPSELPSGVGGTLSIPGIKLELTDSLWANEKHREHILLAFWLSCPTRSHTQSHPATLTPASSACEDFIRSNEVTGGRLHWGGAWCIRDEARSPGRKALE